MSLLQAAGVADTSGTVILSFVAPGQGVGYGGTIAVPGAEATAQWQCMLGSTPVGGWTGANTWGPIAGADGEIVSLQGTNLTPGKNYLAVWNFTQGPSDNYDNVVPAVSATTVVASQPANALNTTKFAVTASSAAPGATATFGTLPARAVLLNWGCLASATPPASGLAQLQFHAPFPPPLALDVIGVGDPASDRIDGIASAFAVTGNGSLEVLNDFNNTQSFFLVYRVYP